MYSKRGWTVRYLTSTVLIFCQVLCIFLQEKIKPNRSILCGTANSAQMQILQDSGKNKTLARK